MGNTHKKYRPARWEPEVSDTSLTGREVEGTLESVGDRQARFMETATRARKKAKTRARRFGKDIKNAKSRFEKFLSRFEAPTVWNRWHKPEFSEKRAYDCARFLGEARAAFVKLDQSFYLLQKDLRTQAFLPELDSNDNVSSKMSATVALSQPAEYWSSRFKKLDILLQSATKRSATAQQCLEEVEDDGERGEPVAAVVPSAAERGVELPPPPFSRTNTGSIRLGGGSRRRKSARGSRRRSRRHARQRWRRRRCQSRRRRYSKRSSRHPKRRRRRSRRKAN